MLTVLLKIPELPVHFILDLQTIYTIISSNSNENRKKKLLITQLGITHTYFLLPLELTLSQEEGKAVNFRTVHFARKSD